MKEIAFENYVEFGNTLLAGRTSLDFIDNNALEP
jgi:hypothetical protein